MKLTDYQENTNMVICCLIMSYPQIEDPKILCLETGKCGDNDPLDIVDIGDYQSQVGMVYKVKILGILALIDENETDYKVISINVKDANAKNINDLRSVAYYKPGCLEAIKYWFENYKN